MHKLIVVVLSTVVLSGCMSAPKPPSCDGSKLRPVNAALYPAEAASPQAKQSYSCGK